MAVNTTVSYSGNKVETSVGGKFDFQLYDDFRASYAGTGGEGTQYIVNLSATEYLDSSALGMSLLLREHAVGDSSSIQISQPSPGEKKILGVANFEKLFDA